MEIPNTLLAPAQGMAALGNSMSNLATTFIEIDARQRMKEDAAIRLAHASKFNLVTTQRLDDLLTGAEKSDPENVRQFQQPMADYFQEQWDYINNDVPDPSLKALLTREHSQLQIHYGKAFNDLVNRKDREFVVNTFIETYGNGIKTYMETDNPDIESKAMTDAAVAVNRARVSGFVSQEVIHKATVDMEKAVNAKEVAKVDNTILNAENLSAKEMHDFTKSILENPKLTLFDKKQAWEKARSTFAKVMKDRVTGLAYQEADKMWPDSKQAMVEVLKPEFMNKYGLTIDQAQNIAQSFSVRGSQKLLADKERQEKNLDVIRAMAITDPAKALRQIASAEDVDPKDALSLKNSIESHVRQLSLMSAQEKALRLDIEDKIKSGIKARIIGGGFKTEQEVVNAVLAEGLTNTSGFIDDALGNFKDFKKDAGSVNYFKSAEEDWDKLISTTKANAKKRELQDIKPKMLEGLRLQMEKDGLRVSDPKVFELYQANRKALTSTWVTRAVETVKEKVGLSNDSFVVPEKTAPLPSTVVVPPPVLTEQIIRQKLKDQKIVGADQDYWVNMYRKNKVIK